MSERFRSFGFDLNSLSVKEEKLNLSGFDKKPDILDKGETVTGFPRTLGAVQMRQDGEIYELYLRYLHKRADGSEVSMPAESGSGGFRRLLELFSEFDGTSNKVIFIDEIENSLHPLLLEGFIHNVLESNLENSGQLVFVTHDTNILNFDFIRSDEIQFAENVSLAEDLLFNIEVVCSRPKIKIAVSEEKLYYYYERQESAVHLLSAQFIIPAARSLFEHSKTTTFNMLINKFYVLETVKQCLAARYLGMFLKERKHEIGIYLSLGERKWKIMLQIVLEVYLVGILAFGASVISGGRFGDVVASKIMQVQTQFQTENNLSQYNSVNPDNMQIVGSESLDIRIDTDVVVIILGVGSLILIISTIIPLQRVLKLKVKDTFM